MKAQNVCTVPPTHRPIVSSNPKALGASGSNPPIRIQKSKIKNAHNAPDFLKIFDFFYFHFQTKNLSLSRSSLATEGANFPIKNRCGRPPRLILFSGSKIALSAQTAPREILHFGQINSLTVT
jgi:hypothetical protein